MPVISEPPVITIRVIVPEPKIVRINILGSGGGGGFPIIPSDIARLSLPNVFLRENTFPGLRLTPHLVTSDVTLTALYSEVVVDCSILNQDITVTLPPALATGQLFRIKRKDDTAHTVFIITSGTDVIDDGQTIVPLAAFQTVTLSDAVEGFWDMGLFLPPFVLPANLALLDQPNLFTDVNSFAGLRLSRKIVSSDYDVQPNDFAIYVQGATGDVNINLPQALVDDGRGQYLRVKKLDDTEDVVAINAFLGDTIDGSISVNLTELYADAQLLEAAVGYWDNTGSAAGGGGNGTANFGPFGRVRDLSPIHGFAFDVLDVDNVTWVEQIRYTEPASSPPPVSSVTWWYKPEITNTTELAAFPTLGNSEFARMDVLFDADPDLGSGFKVFILKSGPADGADPGQVAPDDYDLGTNDFHWESAI
jgi:hypothetical protein